MNAVANDTIFIKYIRITLLLSLIILSIPPSIHWILNCLYHPELQNTTDMEIFSAAGKRFLNSGQLYERSNDYAITYAAGAAVYKFPPAYQLSVVPLLKSGMDDFTFLLFQRCFQLLLYISSSILLIAFIGEKFIWSGKSINDFSIRHKAYQFVLLSILIAAWSRGFYESFTGVEPEIYIYFLMILALFFYTKNKFLSGFFIAFAVTLKIYPILMILFFMQERNKESICGFIAGFVFITFISIYYFGLSEHIFYVTHILPALLTENPIYHIQNTTIASYLTGSGIIDMKYATIIHTVIKLSTLGCILMAGFLLKGKSDIQASLSYALLVAAILLCMANYWPQYQIILTIPVLCLLAYSIHKQSTLIFTITIIAAISLSIREEWFQQVTQHVFSSETQQFMDDLIDYQLRNPLSESYTLLYFFPLLSMLFILRDLMFFVPGILFFTLLTISLNKNNGKINVSVK